MNRMENSEANPVRRTERTIGTLLRIGVITAGVVVLVGGVMFLTGEGGNLATYTRFRSEPVELRTVGLIIADAFRMSSRGVMQFGLLLLIAIPVARVVFSVYAFARLKDWRYVFMTLMVLSLLLYSLNFKG